MSILARCHLFKLMHIQFGAALYNAQEETTFASEHTQERVQLEMCALMHDIQYV